MIDLEVTESRTTHILVLKQLMVCEIYHFFKPLQRIFPYGIQIVVILTVDHGLDVTVDMVEIFQGFPVILCTQVALAEVHLEPHSLNLVDSSLVTTGTEEEVHGVVGLIEHVDLGHLFGGQGVEGSVSLVQAPGLLV